MAGKAARPKDKMNTDVTDFGTDYTDFSELAGAPALPDESRFGTPHP
ncbi:hypothetical protein [Azospirillum palustre]|nr:hypothetical protein [Azospirillum palustre]